MMRIERHYPKDDASLLRLMETVLQPGDSLAAQAGHFLLIAEEATGEIYPCIAGDRRAPAKNRIVQNFGRFPLLTWHLALRLLSNLPAIPKHLMVVVNDWQYLHGTMDRSAFYRVNGDKLPEAFEAEFIKQTDVALLKPAPIKNGVSTSPFFGEMNLRNRYQRRVSRLVRRRQLPPGAILRDTENEIKCELPDMTGELREIYCTGKTGDCTAEIAEMLYHASTATGAPVFVNFYPLVCQAFVEVGTSRAVELFDAPLRAVLNVGLPSSGLDTEQDLFKGCEVSLHRFQ